MYGTLETGIYGTTYNRLAYPITARFFDRINKTTYFEPYYEQGHYDYWYNESYKNYTGEKLIQYMSGLWFNNYNIIDPEIWPDEYLDSFEDVLDGHQVVTSSSDVLKYRVDSYKWEGRVLTVNCSADYHIKKYNIRAEYKYVREAYDYYLTADGGFSLEACIAVTNKSDGELVYLVKHSSFNLKPDYVCKPGTYEDIPYTSSQLYTSHSGTVTKSLKATIPEFIDPEKHDVALYFYDPKADTEISSLCFFNPHNISPAVTDFPENIPGDANGVGFVNSRDVATLTPYLSGASVKISPGADFDGDGKVTASDLLLLRRKLAGADV